VRELIDFVLWAEVDPIRGIACAMAGLTNAKNMFKSAGYEEAPQ
jgi:hypothetical protein